MNYSKNLPWFEKFYSTATFLIPFWRYLFNTIHRWKREIEITNRGKARKLKKIKSQHSNRVKYVHETGSKATTVHVASMKFVFIVTPAENNQRSQPRVYACFSLAVAYYKNQFSVINWRTNNIYFSDVGHSP